MIYNLVINNSNVTGIYNTTFLYKFIQGNFTVQEDAEMCVSQIIIPYSWANISATYYNNASFQYIWVGTTYTVTLPEGFYSTADINNYLQNYMISQNQYLIDNSGNYVFYINIFTNTSYYSNQWLLQPIPVSLPSGYTAPSGGFVYSPSNYTPQIVIQNNKFGDIIGFRSGTYPSSLQSTSYNILSNITPNASPVNSIIVLCDAINNACTTPSNILDTFSINSSYGSNIVYTPYYEKWVSMTYGSFSNMTITLTDQNFRSIPAKDANVMISLLIRQKKKEYPVQTFQQKINKVLNIKQLQFKDEEENKI